MVIVDPVRVMLWVLIEALVRLMSPKVWSWISLELKEAALNVRFEGTAASFALTDNVLPTVILAPISTLISSTQ